MEHVFRGEMMEWIELAQTLKYDQHLSWAELPFEIEKQLGIRLEKENIRTTLRRLPSYKNKVTYEDKKPNPTFDDVWEYYDALKNMEQTMSDLDTKQTKATITINDDKPIGIAFFGDWHIGARGTNYKQFDLDRQLIKQTDGLYFIGMGDYKDNQNALVHPSGTHEQTALTSMQDLLVKSFMTELKDKALALVRGCHDDWDKKLGDKDFIDTLCSKNVADCVNLWHGGGITVNLGSQSYKIRARHKYKNESSMNTTNAQRNLLNDFGPSDVIAVAHKHFPDMQMLDRMRQKVVYFRAGGYKPYDEHGQKLAGYEAIVGVPMIIIYPDRKHLTPFEDLRDGIKYLEALRM